MLAWEGLERYGYVEEAQRTAYRWLYMCVLAPYTRTARAEALVNRMTKAFVDFNGVVPEKYDAVALSHKVAAEYGNQGVDFKVMPRSPCEPPPADLSHQMVPREGFGWGNTSYEREPSRVCRDRHAADFDLNMQSA